MVGKNKYNYKYRSPSTNPGNNSLLPKIEGRHSRNNPKLNQRVNKMNKTQWIDTRNSDDFLSYQV